MITAITTCMGRRGHLEVTLPLMLEEFDKTIVVDWSCPQESGEWAHSQGAYVVWRSGQKYFSASKARNSGALHSSPGVLCFIDADTLVMPGTRAKIESLIDYKTMVLAGVNSEQIEMHDLGGFIAVDSAHFWEINGYNENLEGYALEDSYLRAQLCIERGLTPKRLPQGMLGAMRHTHELRGRHHREPIEVTFRRNHSILTSYLKSHGIEDWVSDPRTSSVAHRPQ